MKRSDHVSLTSNNAQNGKKLRKRRELDAMASSHVIGPIRGRSAGNRLKKSTNGGPSLLYFSNSSSNEDDLDEDEDENDLEEIRHHGGEAYMNLVNKKSSTNHSGSSTIRRHRDWLKRHRKFLSFCHKFCFVFVLLSGFLVLLTLAWLHFSLRAQTQDLNAQLHQGSHKQVFPRNDFIALFTIRNYMPFLCSALKIVEP